VLLAAEKMVLCFILYVVYLLLQLKFAAKLLHQTDKTCHKLKKNAKKMQKM
jgi:hypothetical protein